MTNNNGDELDEQRVDIVETRAPDMFDLERRTIRDAMQRLIDGEPVRSDGKLTIKSLAAEADVKRWILTHRHTDLQSEFRSRIESMEALPEPVQRLTDELKATSNRGSQLADELRQAKADINRYVRIVNMLALEKLELENAVKELTMHLAGTPLSEGKN